ncbi:uncharacterized protein UV8b_03271 [Ustilaginoidea virens]|uniref:tyrosinase n=1 Tax=Ustilaginoidea virens TaxID=1159556 RepID=A0A063BRM1_USTVR|nr:uncharacterized protein UV8b_03271 [Ustilaginoidea virens]QUC19030.1 hypothetical protein UV8b_03271 [Ustilaginoidea virens]GAO18831.1 hypothetical protein UVI_02029880 [Ustilaginoidea virens]
MRSSKLLSALLMAAQAAAQSYYDFGFDIHAAIANQTIGRRQSGNTIAVGQLPRRQDGSLPARLEIREMRQNRYMWDLYILALSAMQAANQNDPLSWYQVAGIHGVPFTPYNNVQPVSGAEQSGYCTHNSVLFPMWHRPYLALYEQQLYTLARSIAQQFSDPGYRQAASEFRIPFFDWSVSFPGQSFLPDSMWSPVINQPGPNGSQRIANPLYSYRFNPLNPSDMIWPPFTTWPETKRAPSGGGSNPPSNNAQVNGALLGQLGSLQQRLYILFTRYTNYNAFGSKAWAASQGNAGWDSIESVHDVIHFFGGSGGHMGFVPVSAFDPLFFLHHANVDRMVAMWQILNGAAWMQPMQAGENGYTFTQGTWQTSSSPLTPFYDLNGNFYTSDSARNWEQFGYTYVDADPSRIGLNQLQSNLRANMNRWWGGSAFNGVQSRDESSAAGVAKNGNYTEWIANVVVDTHALSTGPFKISFFMGEKQDNSTLVGDVAMFSMPAMANTAAPKSSSKSSSTIPLTAALTALVKAGQLKSLDAQDVQPLLQKSLKFQVVQATGEKVDAAKVKGLGIQITSSEVALPKSDDEFPRWGDSVKRFDLY